MDAENNPALRRYVIYSRVLSPDGEKLAITWSGRRNASLKLTTLDHTPKQIWVVSDSVMPAFSPDVARGLEVGRGDGNTLVVFPPGGHRWVLEPSPDGYAIRDQARRVCWSVPHPVVNSRISIGNDAGLLSRWVLERVYYGVTVGPSRGIPVDVRFVVSSVRN
ncbi:hypothetical protein CC2G_003529 [Coprinopsis cinerea AmutBmut pab1-1]|nr:hypothetical protein CC2G_003529 [Coprinopsis cinerea AmutBmut pab1-1]